jgi:hypothetical protein
VVLSECRRSGFNSSESNPATYQTGSEGWWGVLGALAQMLAILVGVFVGRFLMLGAHRRFRWGESAARSVYRWSWVGGGIIMVLVLVVLEPVLGMRISNEPNLASLAFWTTFGVWLECVSRANVIRAQPRTEGRP